MAETKEQEPPKPYRIGLNVTVSAARSLFTVINDELPNLPALREQPAGSC
jgi:hypothetical protein